MSVVLPEPLCPTRARLLPAGMSSETLRTARRSVPRILERDVAELEVRGSRVRGGVAALWRRRLGPVARGRPIEVRVQVREIERVLVHAAQPRQHRLQALLTLAERDRVHRHLAERHLAVRGGQHHRRVRAVIDRRRGERQHGAPTKAPVRELGVLVDDARAERAIRSAAAARRRGASPPSRSRRSRARARGRRACACRGSASCACGTRACRSTPR